MMNTYMFISVICISIISIIVILSAVFFIARYYYYKGNYIKIQFDSKKLYHVTHLMPWIYAQLSKSVEVTLDIYRSQVKRNIIKRDINIDIYNKIISDIRIHFYGTIPKSLSTMLFKYVDTKQIEILLLREYYKQNEAYFNIIEEE